MRVFGSILTTYLLIVLNVSLKAQALSENERAKAFILKVMAEYKNPMAYFPLRKDIFLPTEEEELKMELKHSYPNGAVVLGSIVFIKNEKEFEREPFVDAQGNRMFDNFLRRSKPISLKSNKAFFLSRQKRLLGANPNLGRFLLYNKQFSGN